MTTFLESKWRPLLFFSLKWIFGLGLLAYFLKNDRIDFSLLQTRQQLWGFGLLLFLQVVIFLITNFRWFLISRAQGLETIQLRDCWHFAWIGSFFTSFMPAIVAADFTKVHYLRRRGFETKSLILSVLIDRASAALSLLMFSMVALLAIFFNLRAHEALALLALLTLLYGVVGRYYRHFPKKLFKGIAFPSVTTLVIGHLSMFLKALSLILIIALANEAYTLELFYLSSAGMLFDNLPLTPANFGVGHLVFDYIYKFSDYLEGAQVYNVYFLAKIIFKLSGFVGWLLARRLSI